MIEPLDPSIAPPLTVVLLAVPPLFTINLPSSLTVVLLAIPPLLTVNLLSLFNTKSLAILFIIETFCP